MIDMKELLAFAVEQNASDIQIAEGKKKKQRIKGRKKEEENPARFNAAVTFAIET